MCSSFGGKFPKVDLGQKDGHNGQKVKFSVKWTVISGEWCYRISEILLQPYYRYEKVSDRWGGGG